ncbi:putative quinol monooxygenase [Litoribacter populi]|uniref:putative quinol monooxygenase n=1 Tax=Litoribacter populi TaxID=2598460 RepID=UPI00117EC696|nr:antibiotic biosynthesis monooxygenase family protein [Litoribacter populi]
MLIRTVRMTFQPNKEDEFLEIFNASKKMIRNFPGCSHLELWQDYHQKNIFTTFSHWEDEEALNNYRDSELFRSTWKKTKVLFQEKPVAMSQKKSQEVAP